MRVLIAIGMLIIFISVFFMLTIGGTMFDEAFECSQDFSKPVCRYVGLSPTTAIGVFMIALFFFIDIVSVYLIISNIRTGE